jgi:hypothetical protein
VYSEVGKVNSIVTNAFVGGLGDVSSDVGLALWPMGCITEQLQADGARSTANEES